MIYVERFYLEKGCALGRWRWPSHRNSIQQVFAEKPHVHRAFLENVPQKLDEKEFWTRFAKHEIQIQVKLRTSSQKPLSGILPLLYDMLEHQRDIS